MCGPFPRKRYYHIREFYMESSTSELESEETEDNNEVEVEQSDKLKDDLPEKVYDIYERDNTAVTVDMRADQNVEAWWTHVPLKSLDLSSNQLIQVSPKLENLCDLTTLMLHDNGLGNLPNEIGKLEKLKVLDLKRNKLSSLPLELFSLPDLRSLNLAHNELEELHPDISNLHMLEHLDVSNNKLLSLPCGIGFLVRLLELLLAYNHIKELPPDLVNMRSLRKLDLMHNNIKFLPEGMGGLRKLQILYIQHNNIEALPNLDGCNDIQEIHAANNLIKEIPKSVCSQLPHLKIFDLRDNKIEVIPDEIELLHGLIRLDLTNNSVKVIPLQLASLAHLAHFHIDGNPVKTIRRDILHCGTTRILKALRDRRQLEDTNQAAGSDSKMVGDGLNGPRQCRGIFGEESIFPDKYKMRKTRCLNVTMQNLTEVPEELFKMAADEDVNIVDLSKNRFSHLPPGLEHLKGCVNEIVFANNLLVEIPVFITQFTRINVINIACNKLDSLPKQFGILNTLRELNISNNRFEEIPECIYELQNLEILIAPDNRLKGIDTSPKALGALRRLATLDIRNNNIEYVPPTLGNLKNITTLEIVGNPFRQPRHQILAKGTEAIMSYLRDRIPS